MSASALDPGDFAYLCDLVRTQAAIALEPGKEYLAEHRLAPLATREGFRTPGELIRSLRGMPLNGLHSRVVQAMTVNETLFFRDVHPYTALREEVLPGLLEARAAERKLTIWSAACATGQEPYSIAMLLWEAFPSLQTWDVEIIATDLSESVLEYARRGVYNQLEVNRGLPAPMLVRFFEREGTCWKVKQMLRPWITFRQQNLIDPWNLPGSIDLIFLRNVMIYFDVSTKRELLARARRALRPDGALVLGSAETTLNIDEEWTPEQFGQAWFYRPKNY